MNKKIYLFIRTFTAVMAFFTGILFILCALTAYFTPSRLSVTKQGNEFQFPLSVKYDSDTAIYAAFDTSEKSPEKSNAKIMLFDSIPTSEKSPEKSNAKIMLFDSIPVKDLNVNVTQRKNVILGGMPFGIRIYTDGLVVSGTSPVGNKNPSHDAGIQTGDIILSVNGTQTDTNKCR